MGIFKDNLGKKLIISLIVILFVMIIILFNSGPPKPLVISEGKKIATVQGTYCWNKIINNECVDKVSPVELITNNKVDPISVSPQSKIEIRYKKLPTDKIEVDKWSNKDEYEKIKIIDNIFTAPKNEGVYIYSISGRWEKGSSSSVFVIKVIK